MQAYDAYGNLWCYVRGLRAREGAFGRISESTGAYAANEDMWWLKGAYEK